MGLVHADIKPDNILLGSDDPEHIEFNLLYLIDYGLSSSFLDENGIHKPFLKAKRFVGNVGFASRNSFAQLGKYIY